MKENSKKITKKFKKLKNTIINSFQVKIGWKWMRKREVKIIVPFRSVPTRCIIENSQKGPKKYKKIKKIPLWLHLMRNRNFQKNNKKILKFKKYLYGFI